MEKGFLPLIGRSIGYLVLSEFMCMMLAAMTAVYYKYTLILALNVLAALFVHGGLMYTLASSVAKQDKKNGGSFMRSRPTTLAVCVTLPSVAMYCALLLSRAGVIGELLPIFRLANAHFIPLVYMMIPNETSVAALSVPMLALLGALVLLPAAVVCISYTVTYKNYDVLSSLLYEKK